MRFIVDGGTNCIIKPGEEVEVMTVDTLQEELLIEGGFDEEKCQHTKRLLVKNPQIKVRMEQMIVTGFYREYNDETPRKYEDFFMILNEIKE